MPKNKPPKKPKPRDSLAGKTAAEVIHELEEYNREHKTSLTYGQYVQLKGGSK